MKDDDLLRVSFNDSPNERNCQEKSDSLENVNSFFDLYVNKFSARRPIFLLG